MKSAENVLREINAYKRSVSHQATGHLLGISSSQYFVSSTDISNYENYQVSNFESNIYHTH